MNKDKLAALVTAVGLTFMKSSKPQNCFASRTPKAELNLESQRVIIDQIFAGQFEITAKQNDVPPGMGKEVRFDEDDHIEQHREILV